MRFATRVRTEIEALDSTLAVVALPAAFSRASLARDSLVDVRANPAGGGWAIRGRGDEHWTTTAALSAFVGTETRQSSLLFPVETVTGGAAALIDHGLRTAEEMLGVEFLGVRGSPETCHGFSILFLLQAALLRADDLEPRAL